MADAELPGLIRLDVVYLHDGAVELIDDALVIQTPPRQWHYAISMPVQFDQLPKASMAWEPAAIHVTVKVHQGRLGVACAAADMKYFLAQATVDPSPEPVTVELAVHSLHEGPNILFRNDWHAERPTIATIYAVKVYRPVDRSRSHLVAFYDLNWMPLSFDFMTFLMDAEMARVRQGLESIHVAFAPQAHYGTPTGGAVAHMPFDRATCLWRLSNLLLPMLSFFPTVACHTIFGTRSEAMQWMADRPNLYPAQDQLGRQDLAAIFRALIDGLAGEPEAHRPGAPVQGLRYARQWLDAQKPEGRLPIAITLRDAPYSPERNSNIDAWASFAHRLDPARYLPIFIPDTDTALLGPPPNLSDFPWFAEAAFNVGLRFGIYEIAHLNLLTSGGPSALCCFSESIRYIYFKQIVSGATEATEAHLRRFGHTPGQSPPFVGSHQKWVWEDDDLEVIEREFAAMVARLESP